MSLISKVETWITKPEKSYDGWSTLKPFLFLKLSSSDGIDGWGEAFTLTAREKGVVEIIHNLALNTNSLKNLDPYEFNKKVNLIADGHRGLDYSSATSALEMSLWDIKSKRENKSLSQILSNNPKKKIPIYANTWSEKSPDNEELSKRALELLKQGYGGIKIYPFQNRSVEQAAFCVSLIRGAIGTDTPLMLDLASPADPNNSLKLANLVKKFNPYWFEEPVDGENTRMLKLIKNQTGLRIMTGEKQCGVNHFMETLYSEAVDIFNPDIAGVGGIIDMIKISDLSKEKNVVISPHCWNSMSIAAAAMLHFCAADNNTDKAEIFPDYIANGLKYCENNFIIKNGYAELNDEPGLGVKINVDSLKKITSDYKETKLS